MFKRDEIARRLVSLTPGERVLIGMRVATLVVPTLLIRWPELRGKAEEALGVCAAVASSSGKRENQPDPGSIAEEINRVIPADEIDQLAGPATPAGEALLYALDTAKDPSVDNLLYAIASAYSAIEMSVYNARFSSQENIEASEYNTRIAELASDQAIVEFCRLLDGHIDECKKR